MESGCGAPVRSRVAPGAGAGVGAGAGAVLDSGAGVDSGAGAGGSVASGSPRSHESKDATVGRFRESWLKQRVTTSRNDADIVAGHST